MFTSHWQEKLMTSSCRAERSYEPDSPAISFVAWNPEKLEMAGDSCRSCFFFLILYFAVLGTEKQGLALYMLHRLSHWAMSTTSRPLHPDILLFINSQKAMGWVTQAVLVTTQKAIKAGRKKQFLFCPMGVLSHQKGNESNRPSQPIVLITQLTFKCFPWTLLCKLVETLS